MATNAPPLWLPVGSGRLLMALAIVGAAIVACFVDIPDTGRGFLMGFATVILRDYYTARAAETGRAHELPRADTT